MGDDEQPSWKSTPQGTVSPASHAGALVNLTSTSPGRVRPRELQGYAALCDPEAGIEVRFTPVAAIPLADVQF